MSFAEFFTTYGLIILMVALLVFMFWSSRRRMQKQKVEQEERARQTVPGAEVLLQGGIYGTIVEYDPENLDQPAVVELSPGVEIRVHSQAVLRVITPVVAAYGEDDEVDESDDDLEDDTSDEFDVDHDVTDESPSNDVSRAASDDVDQGESPRPKSQPRTNPPGFP